MYSISTASLHCTGFDVAIGVTAIIACVTIVIATEVTSNYVVNQCAQAAARIRHVPHANRISGLADFVLNNNGDELRLRLFPDLTEKKYGRMCLKVERLHSVLCFAWLLYIIIFFLVIPIWWMQPYHSGITDSYIAATLPVAIFLFWAAYACNYTLNCLERSTRYERMKHHYDIASSVDDSSFSDERSWETAWTEMTETITDFSDYEEDCPEDEHEPTHALAVQQQGTIVVENLGLVTAQR